MIEAKNEELGELRLVHGQFEEEQKGKRKEVAKAQKEVTRQERTVKKAEKELEEQVRCLFCFLFLSS